MAEVYHIYDYESLPPTLVATYFVGLRENSRTKLKLNGMKYPIETILLASAVDRLSMIFWSKTKDGEKNRNRPESITMKLLDKKQERDYEVFDSPEEFEEAMRKIEGREV